MISSENAKMIAIIGSKDTVLPFKTIGLKDYPVTNNNEALSVLKEIVSSGYGIIYIEENFAKDHANEILRLNKEFKDIVITIIPGANGGSDFAMKKIATMVKKAIGIDISV